MSGGEISRVVEEPPPSLFADVAHAALVKLGFGHVSWLVDLVTTTDAEYDVEFA